MQNANKFTQYTDLSSTLDEAPPPPPKTKWSAKEVEEIRTQSYLEGRQSVEAQAATEASACFERMATACEELYGRITQLAWDHKSHAAELALTVGKKLAHAALNNYGTDEITKLIEENLDHIADQTVIELTISEQFHEALTAALQDLVQNRNMQANIEVSTSNELDATDCILKWSNGSIERDTAELEQEIENVIRDRLEAERQTQEQLDLFET